MKLERMADGDGKFRSCRGLALRFIAPVECTDASCYVQRGVVVAGLRIAWGQSRSDEYCKCLTLRAADYSVPPGRPEALAQVFARFRAPG